MASKRKRSDEEEVKNVEVSCLSPHPPNPLKAKLARGEIVICGTINTPSVENAVMMAPHFDALWIEGEHSAITLESTRNMVLATRGMRAVPIVRVPWQELWMAKRVLDIGALGVIFPFCSTPERAQTATQAVRYPPQGARGCGPGLSQLRWASGVGDSEEWYKWSNENVTCVCIIEEQKAIDNLDAITATPGIDVLFIGTSDLSFSLTGSKFKKFDPRVVAAIDQVLKYGKERNIPVGCPAGDAEDIAAKKAQGFTFFQGPADTSFLQQALKSWSASLAAKDLETSSSSTAKGSVSMY